MLRNRQKQVKNFKEPGENRQKCQKTAKMSQNHQKCQKTEKTQ